MIAASHGKAGYITRTEIAFFVEKTADIERQFVIDCIAHRAQSEKPHPDI